jgi:hypothetical protein
MGQTHGRVDFFRSLPKGLIVAECGVFEGGLSAQILEACEPRELFLVDIFEGIAHSGDGIGHDKALDVAESYKVLQETYRDHPVVRLVKSEDLAWLRSLPRQSLDVLYIDSDHSYEHVRDSLQEALRVVKRPWGWVGTHDYCPNSFPGLVRAVDEFKRDRSHQIVETYRTTSDFLTSVFFCLNG